MHRNDMIYIEKHIGNRALDRLRGLPWVGRLTDRAPDHDVVGPGLEGLAHVHGALLVVGVGDRADARAHHQQARVDLAPQFGHFQAGGDHAVATGGEGRAGAREHQGARVALEAEVLEVALVEAGQRGDGEDADSRP